jgi:hypothetical protein
VWSCSLWGGITVEYKGRENKKGKKEKKKKKERKKEAEAKKFTLEDFPRPGL